MPVAVGAGFVDDDLGEAGSHGDGDFDVERDFNRAAGGGGVAVEIVEQDVVQRDVGQTGLLLVGGDVAGGVAVEFQEADRLAGAGQRHARDVGIAEIAAHIGATGAGTGLWFGGGAAGPEARARGRKVIEAADVGNGDGEIEGGFDIRGVEGAVFRGMIVNAHRHVKCLLDVGDGAVDIEHEAVGITAGDGEIVGFGKGDHGGVIVGGRAELLGELGRGEEMAVGGAGGIVKLLEQGGERLLVAQGQGNREAEMAARVEPAHRRKPGRHGRHVAVEDLQLGGRGVRREEQAR